MSREMEIPRKVQFFRILDDDGPLDNSKPFPRRQLAAHINTLKLDLQHPSSAYIEIGDGKILTALVTASEAKDGHVRFGKIRTRDLPKLVTLGSKKLQEVTNKEEEGLIGIAHAIAFKSWHVGIVLSGDGPTPRQIARFLAAKAPAFFSPVMELAPLLDDDLKAALGDMEAVQTATIRFIGPPDRVNPGAAGQDIVEKAAEIAKQTIDGREQLSITMQAQAYSRGGMEHGGKLRKIVDALAKKRNRDYVRVEIEGKTLDGEKRSASFPDDYYYFRHSFVRLHPRSAAIIDSEAFGLLEAVYSSEESRLVKMLCKVD